MADGDKAFQGDGGQASLDAKGVSEGIAAILASLFEEHMQWNNGFLQWSNQQLMYGQPIPPQADADFINRQNWIIGHMKRFEAPAQILARAGDRALADAVKFYADGLTKLLKDFQATKGRIAADDAATAGKIAAINDKMHADTLAGGAARLKMQQDTFRDTFEMNAKTMADQRASFERMNKGFIDNIDN